ncbi:alpha-amylase family glycosyl hydrolase [Prevotella dentasini]|uniref:alpha-amylase family glycosyl hydrolase n=1 Tax=Prevotella dentasini TaxID=589537 RepID=UPI00046AF33C|nr:alpha-amylase family glycosyl hydrolase [Prevotella dentasini]
MKRILSSVFALGLSLTALAQGWPANYGGVMLQGFYWDSFDDSKWTVLENKANDFAGYFDLVWVPQSGKASASTSMGYDPLYYFNQNSSFGTEAELKSMIETFRQKNIGTIADVVINHHGTDNGWFGFPAETYNGTAYQHKPADICANDDGGKAATEAGKQGIELSSNYDEGEDWDGMRDLDHKSENVQTIVKAYEKFLLNDLGYTGFRYDMVKGFNGSHIADYNQAAGVAYSVGECWDSKQTITNWIDATGRHSAAFDFPFKYNVRDAVDGRDWRKLKTDNNLITEPAYRQYAVTFVENHDTEVRASGNGNGPIRRDTLAANAYLLAMPGTPCVFYKHYLAYPGEIKAMITARKLAGITNMSNFTNKWTNQDLYANEVNGTKGNLLVVLGNTANYQQNISDYVQVLSGYHYAYYLSKSINSAWVTLPGGTYDGAQETTLKAITADTDAQLVYTMDGSEPTASNGTKASDGTTISIPAGATTVLKVGLLINGSVTGIVSQTYSLVDFKPYDIKVYVNADDAGAAWASASTTAASPAINSWIWGGNHATKSGKWPGDKITTLETVDGKKWFVQNFTIENSSDLVNFVFSVGTGSPQTVNAENIRQSTFITVNPSTDAQGHYNLTINTATGIDNIETDNEKLNNSDLYYYTLSGQRVAKPTQRGIYIHQGKKIIIR